MERSINHNTQVLPLETQTRDCSSEQGTEGPGGGLAPLRSLRQLDFDMTISPLNVTHYLLGLDNPANYSGFQHPSPTP